MFRNIALFSILTLAVSCAQTSKRIEKQNLEMAKKDSKAHQFDGHCGAELCLKKAKVACDPTITVEYKEKSYCFSSNEKRDIFLRDIDKNIQMAKENWAAFGGAQR